MKKKEQQKYKNEEQIGCNLKMFLFYHRKPVHKNGSVNQFNHATDVVKASFGNEVTGAGSVVVGSWGQKKCYINRMHGPNM